MILLVKSLLSSYHFAAQELGDFTFKSKFPYFLINNYNYYWKCSSDSCLEILQEYSHSRAQNRSLLQWVGGLTVENRYNPNSKRDCYSMRETKANTIGAESGVRSRSCTRNKVKHQKHRESGMVRKVKWQNSIRTNIFRNRLWEEKWLFCLHLICICFDCVVLDQFLWLSSTELVCFKKCFKKTERGAVSFLIFNRKN